MKNMPNRIKYERRKREQIINEQGAENEKKMKNEK